MDQAQLSVLSEGLHEINLSGKVTKGTSYVLKDVRRQKARIAFLAADADVETEGRVLTSLCKNQGVKLEIVPSKVFLGYAFSSSDRKKYATPRKKQCWGSCAVINYGPNVTPKIEAFRAAFDPSTEDAPA